MHLPYCLFLKASCNGLVTRKLQVSQHCLFFFFSAVIFKTQIYSAAVIMSQNYCAPLKVKHSFFFLVTLTHIVVTSLGSTCEDLGKLSLLPFHMEVELKQLIY